MLIVWCYNGPSNRSTETPDIGFGWIVYTKLCFEFIATMLIIVSVIIYFITL